MTAGNVYLAEVTSACAYAACAWTWGTGRTTRRTLSTPTSAWEERTPTMSSYPWEPIRELRVQFLT